MNNRTNPLDLNKMNILYDSVEQKSAFIKGTGINLPTLRNMLNGDSVPSVAIVASFAKWFGLPCGAMFLDYSEHCGNISDAVSAASRYSDVLYLKDAVLFYNAGDGKKKARRKTAGKAPH